MVADEAEEFMTFLSSIGEDEQYGMLPREWFDCEESYNKAMSLFNRLEGALHKYRQTDAWRIPDPKMRAEWDGMTDEERAKLE